MYRFALVRYCKKLQKLAEKSPKKTATLRMSWLARRYFRGYRNEAVRRRAVDFVENYTGESASVDEIQIIYWVDLRERTVGKLAIKLTVQTPNPVTS